MAIDGLLDDWTAADRLDTAATNSSGFEWYGKVINGEYVFAMRAPVGSTVGGGTTVWLNTDQNAATGFNVFGVGTGAEYNIDFNLSTGVPALFTGDAGQTAVSGATVDYAYSADHRVVEFAVPLTQVNDPNGVATVYADVNNAVFLPTPFSAGGYVVGTAPPPPATTIGTVTLDGSLADWTAANRIDNASNAVAGFEVYGRFEGDNYIVAIKGNTTIGANTTAWLNTDRNPATGYQIFPASGPNSGGAEYNVNFDANGVPNLYTGSEGQTLVASNLAHGFSADRTVVEFAIPKSQLANAPSAVDLLFDVNNSVFLPTSYASPPYTIKDPASLPTPTGHGPHVGIVFSDTSAARYFNATAYSDLFMAAQNQVAMAGVPYDLLTEADLKDVNILKNYTTLVFPSFSNVNKADVSAIQTALTAAVEQYGVSLITANNFMTNDETGADLPTPYAVMNRLLGVAPLGYDSVSKDAVVASTGAAAVLGYAPNEAIHTYNENATSKVGTAYFQPLDTATSQVVAVQTVTGHTSQTLGDGQYNAILTTQTGGKNVVFSTESMLADTNMLSHAIDWTIQQQHPTTPELSLHMSRQASIVATRVDMDLAMYSTAAIDPPGATPGVYDIFVPLMQQWKQAYNFTGSYYLDIGDFDTNPHPNGQDSNEGLLTNWTKSAPYYQQLLAMGGEIGSHTVTHPFDTNVLTSAQYTSEFAGSKSIIESHLPIQVRGVAIPGAPETLATDRNVWAAAPYDYITGRYTGIGSDYPSAFGHLSASSADQQHLYLAPNLKSDFSLVEALPQFGGGLTAYQAEQEWEKEYNDLALHADLPVYVWTWHDYGAAEWPDEGQTTTPYHYQNPDGTFGPTGYMFTKFVGYAAQKGAEFVTLADLADRITSSEAASVTTSYAPDAAGGTLTATVTGSGLGKFALDLGAGSQIGSVKNWYAYDDDSVFTPSSGGAFEIHLMNSGVAADVTHITALPARAELVSLSGDGANLTFAAVGEGQVAIDLQNPAGRAVKVTGATVASLAGDKLVLDLGAIGSHTVAVTLAGTSNPPTVAHPIADGAATEDSPYSFVVPADAFADADPGDTLSYAASVGGAALPTWLHFDATTRTFSGTPLNADVGTLSVTVTATDSTKASVSDSFNIVVANTNDAPTVATPLGAQAASEDVAFSYVVPAASFADVDVGDTLTFSAAGSSGGALPTWLKFDAAAHSFSGTPKAADVGTLPVTVTATDKAGASVADVLTITVAHTNHAPTLTAPIPDQAASDGKAFAYAVPDATFVDSDVGDKLSYAASLVGGAVLPTWLTFDPATHSFSGTPASTDVGAISVQVTASDVAGAKVSDAFDIVVSTNGVVKSGGSGNDTLIGTAGPDTLNGLGGNDLLDGLAGADSMNGGAGNDTFVVDNVGDQVIEAAGGGTDTVQTALAAYTLGANLENLVYTGAGAFLGTGNALANAITGGAGNDTLDGGAGGDTLTGGLGDDVYLVDSSIDKVVENANGGIDTVQSSVTLTLAANVENLILLGSASLNGTGNELANQLTGNDGANRLDGGLGADALLGGLGNDVYVVDNVGDVVTEAANAGADTIETTLQTYALAPGGNVENLTFTGAGNFNGLGNELANTITGGAGADTLDGGNDALSDRLLGGLGDDLYLVRAGDIVTENANAGQDTVQTALASYTLTANVENLTYTGAASFTGAGNALANTITGGAGNDELNGGAGADTLNGGAGNDSYFVDDVNDVIIEAAAPSGGVDTVTAAAAMTGYTLKAGLENLIYTGTLAFTATGNDDANNIVTGSGADTVKGGLGNDTINGGSGDDKLYGESGNDSLIGGAGADRLEGGDGLDTLSGGANADTFVFGAASTATTDRILDFSVAEGDKIGVVASAYAGLTAGTALNLDWFETVTTTNGAATKAHAEFIYNSATRTLLWDDDGAGAHAAVAVATFASTVALHSTDILLL